MTDTAPQNASAPQHERQAPSSSGCPVHSGQDVVTREDGVFEVHGHAAVRLAALDNETFSSAVSRHLQIPNGLDGAEHTRYRALIDRYFTPEAMHEFLPEARRAARRTVAALPRGEAFDAVEDLGYPFAVAAQSAWLGWPQSMADQLIAWVRSNQQATRSGDPARTAEVAERFDAIIRSVIEPRRDFDGTEDLTDQLIHDTTAGELTDEQIVSILRNWTGGDLTSIAQCVGVIVHFLLEYPQVAERIRGGVVDEQADAMLEEFLRMDDPFVSNRRRTVRDTELAGTRIPEGSTVVLNWAQANLDPRAFGDGEYDPHAHEHANLTYGAGKHVCPGRPLARVELRELVRALLATGELERAGQPEREQAPLGGFAHVPVVLR